jgi:hypothetical protein
MPAPLVGGDRCIVMTGVGAAVAGVVEAGAAALAGTGVIDLAGVDGVVGAALFAAAGVGAVVGATPAV